MINARNTPNTLPLPFCVTLLCSILAWCAGIFASENAQRPYVPPSETPSFLISTPEQVAREVLIQVAPGFMDFPEGKVVAEWLEFQNSEKVEPAYKNLLTRHSPERLMKVFPTFNPAFDRVRVSHRTGRSVVLHDYSRIYKLRFPSDADIAAICEELKSLPGVLFAEPNGFVYPQAVPNDPYFRGTTLPGPQWNLDRIRAPEAWDLSKGDPSTVIAIIDGGVHQSHLEFAGKLTGDNTPPRWNGHGTEVASIAAANTNNGIGIAGVDWHATIISKNIASTIDNPVSDDEVARKIREAVEGGADIINCSWADTTSSSVVRKTIGDAYKLGIATVAGMGNFYFDPRPLYPAAYQQHVLAVGATAHGNYDVRWQDSERPTQGSSSGPHIDVAAPGENIPVTGNIDSYVRRSGTSFATPHVSGTAGLMLAYYKELFNEDLTNEDVYEIIKRSARDIQDTGFDETSGHGLLDAKKALDMLTPPYVLLHQSTTGMDVGLTKRTMTLVDFPDSISSRSYAVRQHEIRESVSFGVTFSSPPEVWGNPTTQGFGAANPNYGLPWTGPVPGTITTTGCDVRTFVYRVFTVGGQSLGWFPCEPGEAVMDFTVHGTLANALANGNMEEVSVSGADTTLASWTATGPWAQDNTYRSYNDSSEVGEVGTHSAGSYDPQTGTGTLTSNSFVIYRPYINLKVCGYDSSVSRNQNTVALQVLENGSWTTKRRTFAPGTDDFTKYTWDVSAYDGSEARIVGMDGNSDSTNAWIGVDAIALSVASAVTPSGVNQEPTAGNDDATTDEDVAATISVLDNDSDPERDPLTVIATSIPSNGTVTSTGRSITYTPNTNFNGTDSFVYLVSDGYGGTATATVRVTVTAVNDPPKAVGSISAQSLTVGGAAASVDVSSKFSDSDGNSLTYSATTSAASVATVSVSGSTVTMTPVAAGSATITVTASDGALTATQPISVTVTASVTATPPSAPTNFTATAGNRQVVLRWSNPNNATITKYQYRRSTNSGSSWSPDWTDISGSGSGTTSYTVRSLNNGTAYTFQVHAVNSGGNGTASASASATPTAPVTVTPPPVTRPAAPTNFRASAGNHQVVLSWSNPNNATITKYQYRRSTNSGSSWSPDWTDISGSGSGTTSYTVRSLNNGTAYTFQVHAVNSGGNGTASASASATPTAPVTVTPPPVTRPAAPTNFRASAGNRQVVLSWSNPNNATITKYQYRRSTNSGSSWSPNWTDISGSGASTTSYTVRSLNNGTAYTFQVHAVNAGGNGTASSSASATPTAPVTRPSAPGNFRASAGNRQVVLRWSNPNNATITKYQYRRSTNSGSSWSPDWTDISGSGSGTTSYTVRSLNNGTRYTFQVRAVNAGGNGTASSSASATPTAPVTVTPPPAPTNFTATAGNGQVVLRWSNPNNASITKYQYRRSTSSSSSWSPNWTDISGSGSGTTSYTVGSLNNGTRYTFQVRAVNAGGNGTASSSASATPTAPVTPPPAPTNFTATAGNGQVVLSWSNPNNASITKYQYRQSTNSGSSWSPDWTDISGSGSGTTSYTVRSLNNGTRYTFQVRAVNAGGNGTASASASATPTAPVSCDFNGDGEVNQTDFALFGAAFGSSSSDANFDARMDYNGDGTINFADFIIFGECYGAT